LRNVILKNVILRNVILRNFILTNGILTNAILPNAVLLNGILPSNIPNNVCKELIKVVKYFKIQPSSVNVFELLHSLVTIVIYDCWTTDQGLYYKHILMSVSDDCK